MATLLDSSSDLQARFDALCAALNGADDGCGPRADETAWFRLVDEAAASPNPPMALLEDVGGAFARTFVVPYVHMTDLPGVLAEVAGLLAVHHRARLSAERIESGGALVSLRIVGDAARGGDPTAFDLAVLRATLASVLPGARIEAAGSAQRLRVRLA